jgi:hypothetical protein
MPKLSWFAEYQDGSRFPQIAEDGTERSYDNIPNRDSIACFCLFKVEDKKPVFTLYLDPGQKLIYRRRVFKVLGGTDKIFYLVGWRKTVGGECVQAISYIHEETNYVQMAGKFREDHPLFDSPTLREFEKVAGE